MAFPEPPWTQAPSEVLAWGTTVGGRAAPTPRVHRPARVRGYEIHLPVADEPRILARMTRLGVGRSKEDRVHVPHLVTRLAHHAPSERFVGRVGGTRIEVQLRKRNRMEVRVTFTPSAPFRRAWRIATTLGLRPAEGTWL